MAHSSRSRRLTINSKAKPGTLIAMRDGDPSKIDRSEAGLIAGAGNSCQPALQ